MQFVVEAAGVAHGLAGRDPAPEGRLVGLAVGAKGPLAPRCALQSDISNEIINCSKWVNEEFERRSF